MKKSLTIFPNFFFLIKFNRKKLAFCKPTVVFQNTWFQWSNTNFPILFGKNTVRRHSMSKKIRRAVYHHLQKKNKLIMHYYSLRGTDPVPTEVNVKFFIVEKAVLYSHR